MSAGAGILMHFPGIGEGHGKSVVHAPEGSSHVEEVIYRVRYKRELLQGDKKRQYPREKAIFAAESTWDVRLKIHSDARGINQQKKEGIARKGFTEPKPRQSYEWLFLILWNFVRFVWSKSNFFK